MGDPKELVESFASGLDGGLPPSSPAGLVSYQEEVGDWEREELRSFRAKNASDELDIQQRKEYANEAVKLARIAIGFWIVMFVLAAVANLFKLEFLSDQALMALTAGATVNVLAAFIGVIRGLFGGSARPSPWPSRPAAKKPPTAKRANSDKR